jgi:hypothetical protein
MNRAAALALFALLSALGSTGAAAQADNSNSLTFPDRLWNALFVPAAPATGNASPLAEALRPASGDRHAEALSAAEVALLYGRIEPDDVDVSPQ